MLLGEMGLPPDEKTKGACERFLDLHQLDNGAFSCPSRNEKVFPKWAEPCLTGNMVRTLHMLGYENDPRVRKAVDWMPEAQLDDGGWNCDWPEKKVKHSSFMSTIEPLWAYSEIPRQKWTRKMKRSIDQGAEFLLMHRVYKSDNHHWRPSLSFFTALHFPMYYFYDALHGLRVLTKLGYADDERTRDAVHLILSKRRPDGKWLLDGDWDRELLLGEKSHREGPTPKERKRVVTIEELGKPSKWVTLNCYRALSKTGDVTLSRK